MKPVPITFYHLRDLFDYNPETGVLKWAMRPSPRSLVQAGDVVYLQKLDRHPAIRFQGKVTPVHRVIWKWMTGFDPPKMYLIDHKDGNPRNNKWSNLRLATHSQNSFNACYGEDKNIYWCSRAKKWRVDVRANGLKIHVGRYKTKEEAQAAAREARQRHHGAFAVDNREPEGGWPDGM